MKTKLKIAAVGALVALALPMAAQAQWWAQHPAYLHAMSNLRQAYWLIERHDDWDSPAKPEEARAANEIRAAYQELKQAAIVDDKDIDDQPPPNFPWGDHRGRLHKAMDLLRDSHNQVSGEEDTPQARGLRDRAVKHIDEAGRWTDAAIHAWNF